MLGLYDMIDEAIADALGVDVGVYIDVIENKCTLEEADLIISAVWTEDEFEIERAKELFNKHLQ